MITEAGYHASSICSHVSVPKQPPSALLCAAYSGVRSVLCECYLLPVMAHSARHGMWPSPALRPPRTLPSVPPTPGLSRSGLLLVLGQGCRPMVVRSAPVLRSSTLHKQGGDGTYKHVVSDR